MTTDLEEEVWRLPQTARGRDTRLGTRSGSDHPPSLSPAAKARLSRIVRRTPEVMVKITGRSRGIVHLKQHLDYITRNGRLLAELQDGTKVETRADLRALHDDWLAANALTERSRPNPNAAQSVGIILSMPAGTPPDRLHDAARTWAREVLANHDWLLVRHDDRDHPHVHVTARAVGHNGRRLIAGPADLQRWRETFARELRRLGVEAEATPRRARGIVPKPEVSAVHRITARGGKSVVGKRREAEALREADQTSSVWERAVQDRQRAIRNTYLARAEQLERGEADDRRLAKDIRAFVAGMSVPLTRRQAMVAELGRVRAEHQPSAPIVGTGFSGIHRGGAVRPGRADTAPTQRTGARDPGAVELHDHAQHPVPGTVRDAESAEPTHRRPEDAAHDVAPPLIRSPRR